MKRVVAFMFFVVLLVGAAAPKETRAEEYLTVFEVLDELGISYSEDMTGYSSLSCPYFMFYKTYDAESNLLKEVLYLSNRCPNGWKVSSYYILTWNGYTLSNSGGDTFFLEDDKLVRRVEVGGQPSNAVLYNGGCSTFEVVYANYDTSFLSNCVVFTDIQNDDIVHEHVWTLKEESATCTEDGKSWEECECGKIQNEIVCPATGHGDLIYETIQAPTMEEEGTYVEKCAVCGTVINTGIIPVIVPTATPTPTPIPTPTNTPTPTLPPEPELMGQVVDFSFIVFMAMLLMQEFPLNLLMVGCLVYVGFLIFDDSKKGLKK